MLTWGETGRYPLVYECLNLTIKYVKRLQSLSENSNSFVSLAFKEQQKLKLDWFNNIEPILKTDESYLTDHVTLNKKKLNNHTAPVASNPSQHNSIIYKSRVKTISPQSVLAPIISKHFTPHIIIKSLKTHFKETWQHCKNSSPKLEFYNRVKDTFCKEQYLDYVNNYYDRANLTKLRISAHELHIETGRHKNIAREDRHCKWCKLSMGIGTVEDEDHLLHTCDLYAQIRTKSLTLLSKITEINVPSKNYMLLLCHLNESLNTQPWANVSQSSTHTYKLALDHQNANTLANTLSNPSTAASVSRTIAKHITLCFDHRKQLSTLQVHSTETK